jgi:arylsulfatase A-like enzyme
VCNKYDSYAWYGPFWALAATAPSRLYKAFTTEGGIHVPLILRYPPITVASGENGIDRSFTTVMDITPTLLELARASHPGTMYRSRPVVPIRGKSWVGDLKDPKTYPVVHDENTVTGWELFDHQGLRKGKWKIVLVPPPFPDRGNCMIWSRIQGRRRI